MELAVQLFQLMGIAREDRDKRAQWRQRGFRFFDAPAAIILSADNSLSDSRILLDVGLITQTICLAALNYDLGTCIGVQGVQYPEVVRKFTGIHKSKRIIVSIAIGYPDWDFPANKLESKREPVESITTWCGFE
jgi:nitroreductase